MRNHKTVSSVKVAFVIKGKPALQLTVINKGDKAKQSLNNLFKG